MKIIISFFLALFFYSLLLFFFLYFILIQDKKESHKIVYVHQVITKVNVVNGKKNQKKEKKIKLKKDTSHKEIKKKPIKTQDIFSKGGKENIKIDDIFSNVSDNIKTTKIEQKKQRELTKKRGNSISSEIKKNLLKLEKTEKITISFSEAIGKESDKNYIQTQLSKVWSKLSTKAGEFIIIHINIEKGNIKTTVISTNLDTIRINLFLNYLKDIDVSKIISFSGNITFKSKLKE